MMKRMNFFVTNHWACANQYGGHAILLGAQWSLASDYGYRREFSFDICLLGFAFGFKILPKEELKIDA